MDSELEHKLPRGVAISWGLVKQPQRGPKREMSIEQIVNTAVSIADKDGLSAVSMSRVAASLGFTTMSLYRYVPGKEELLLLMQEAVADFPLPPENEDEDWRQGIRVYVQAVINILRAHPWFADIPISGAPITPNSLKFVEWLLRVMRKLPLDNQEKMSILLLLVSYARACGVLQRDLDRAMRAGTTPGEFSGSDFSAALKQLVTADRFPNLHPVVASGDYTGENVVENNVGDDFDFGLERILDGIESYIASKRTS